MLNLLGFADFFNIEQGTARSTKRCASNSYGTITHGRGVGVGVGVGVGDGDGNSVSESDSDVGANNEICAADGVTSVAGDLLCRR